MSSNARRLRNQEPDAARPELFRAAQHRSLDPFVILKAIRDPAESIVDFTWTYANPAAERVHGRDPTGDRLLEVFPGLGGQTGIFRRYVEVVESGEPHDIEFLFGADGSERWYRNMAVRLDDGVAVTFSDITERKVAEERLRAREREARLLAKASRIFSRSLDPERTLENLARISNAWLSDYGISYLLDDEGKIERVGSAHVDPNQQPLLDRLGHVAPTEHESAILAAKVIETGETVYLPRLDDAFLKETALNQDHLEAMRALDPTSAVFVPLKARGRVLGVFAVATIRGGKPILDEQARELLEELSSRAALAIDNARLIESEQVARREAEEAARRTLRLQSVTSSLSRALPRSEVLEVIIHQAIEAFGADAGSIVEVSPDGDDLHLLHSVGMPDHVKRKYDRISVDDPFPVGDVVRTGNAVLLESPRHWNETYSVPPTHEGIPADDGAWAALPLKVDERLLGALALSFRTSRRFTDDDLQFMMALANQCAQALERARLYGAEKDARAAAETANQAKVHFLSAMSHELRTPLNAIGGYVDLIEMGVHGPVHEAQREALGRIKQNQAHLLTLINDVLSFARPGIGKLKLRTREIPADAAIARIEELISPILQKHGISYEHRPCPRSPRMEADPDRVQQILLNLVTNAVNHTDRGGRIILGCETQGDSVRIHVEDNGTGIARDKLEAIFDPFVQYDRERLSEPFKGVGLGLAISLELARGMGGDLTVRSVEGEGSTFTLSLPLCRTASSSV